MKKKDSLQEILQLSNPYQWYALIVLIIGIFLGGAIGGLTGFFTAWGILKISKNKKLSHPKKALSCLAITIGGIIIYFVLSLIILSVIEMIF